MCKLIRKGKNIPMRLGITLLKAKASSRRWILPLSAQMNNCIGRVYHEALTLESGAFLHDEEEIAMISGEAYVVHQCRAPLNPGRSLVYMNQTIVDNTQVRLTV